MQASIRYPWQQRIIDAFVAQADELSLRIDTARGAIAMRLIAPNEPDVEERIALSNGLRALRVLFIIAFERRGIKNVANPGMPVTQVCPLLSIDWDSVSLKQEPDYSLPAHFPESVRLL